MSDSHHLWYNSNMCNRSNMKITNSIGVVFLLLFCQVSTGTLDANCDAFVLLAPDGGANPTMGSGGSNGGPNEPLEREVQKPSRAQMYHSFSWDGAKGKFRGILGLGDPEITIPDDVHFAISRREFLLEIPGNGIAIMRLSATGDPKDMEKFIWGNHPVRKIDMRLDGDELVVSFFLAEGKIIEKKLKRATKEDGRNFTGPEDPSTTRIRGLTEFNQIPIATVEALMRPGAMSDAGFLGPAERLLDVLAGDNEFVVRAGFTHEQLARPLREIIFIAQAYGSGRFEYKIGGRAYQISVASDVGSQYSPLDSKEDSTLYIVLKNVETGDSFGFSGLLPHLISHGFYQGFGTPYRLSPERIMQMFPFLQSQKEKKTPE